MTPYQTFRELLAQAHDASEAVDRFDLRAEPASAAKWKTLLAEQDADFVALVEHVRSMADQILIGILKRE